VTDGAFSDDPIGWFLHERDRAAPKETFEATRAALATVDRDGRPSVRYVLVKLVDQRGFCFFTNLHSAKARQLEHNSNAALAFHWASTDTQVRVQGPVVAVAETEANAYFASRPRGSQFSAWASDQSEPIENREALEAKLQEVERKLGTAPQIPRPPFWGGFRLVPERIELWHGRDHRLHDRWLFARAADGWSRQRLQP
jgi:pyridoxamine 5'-phosphate oxidase